MIPAWSTCNLNPEKKKHENMKNFSRKVLLYIFFNICRQIPFQRISLGIVIQAGSNTGLFEVIYPFSAQTESYKWFQSKLLKVPHQKNVNHHTECTDNFNLINTQSTWPDQNNKSLKQLALILLTLLQQSYKAAGTTTDKNSTTSPKSLTYRQ